MTITDQEQALLDAFQAKIAVAPAQDREAYSGVLEAIRGIYNLEGAEAIDARRFLVQAQQELMGSLERSGVNVSNLPTLIEQAQVSAPRAITDPIYSSTIRDQATNAVTGTVRVFADGSIDGLNSKETTELIVLSISSTRTIGTTNQNMLHTLLSGMTAEGRQEFRDNIIDAARTQGLNSGEISALADRIDAEAGALEREARGPVTPPPPAPLPTEPNPVLSAPVVEPDSVDYGVGVQVQYPTVTPTAPIGSAPPAPSAPTQPAPVAAATSIPSGWGYGIATDYKNGAEGGAADQQIGNDAFEITSIAALLQERFGITVQGNPPTLAQLNTALQSPEMQARLAEYNQGKPADQQITPADLDLTRIAALTGEARDAANDKFANGIAALANSGIARDGLAAREADGVPLAAVDSDTVRAMQDFMNEQGFKDAAGNALAVDGIVGPKTTAAFAALEAAAGVNPATGNISPALLDFVRERQDLALGREEERAMAIAAENGALTRDEVARMNAIDDAIDALAERGGVDVAAIRTQFAEVRAAMIAPDGKHEGQTVEQELGALVAMVPTDNALRTAAGVGASR
jgi:hypothetical protein